MWDSQATPESRACPGNQTTHTGTTIFQMNNRALSAIPHNWCPDCAQTEVVNDVEEVEVRGLQEQSFSMYLIKNACPSKTPMANTFCA